MTATTTGLPDRYRPLDEVGPEERTDTGVIHCWRAKDRILNRDVAIRVHVPGSAAAPGWITRALTAGGLGTLLIGTVVVGVTTLAGFVLARIPELRVPLAAVRARLGRG